MTVFMMAIRFGKGEFTPRTEQFARGILKVLTSAAQKEDLRFCLLDCRCNR